MHRLGPYPVLAFLDVRRVTFERGAALVTSGRASCPTNPELARRCRCCGVHRLVAQTRGRWHPLRDYAGVSGAEPRMWGSTIVGCGSDVRAGRRQAEPNRPAPRCPCPQSSSRFWMGRTPSPPRQTLDGQGLSLRVQTRRRLGAKPAPLTFGGMIALPLSVLLLCSAGWTARRLVGAAALRGLRSAAPPALAPPRKHADRLNRFTARSRTWLIDRERTLGRASRSWLGQGAARGLLRRARTAYCAPSSISRSRSSSDAAPQTNGACGWPSVHYRRSPWSSW